MQTYLVVRRSAWPSQREQRDAEARSTAEALRMADDIAAIRSYVLEERDRTIGSVCIVRASSPEAVRRHAAAAELPVDEIVRVADDGVGAP
jgi:Nickel responsive protein SCO4226-like